MPLVLLVSGIGTFVLIGVAGLSVIERYLIVAALALLVFAAVGVGGFTMLRPGRLRTGWMVVSARARARGRRLHRHARRPHEAHATSCSSAATRTTRSSAVLHEPAVTRALRCGPLTVPNHKLVPDARWILDLPRDARARARRPEGPRHPRRGVALYVTSRFAIFRHAFTNPVDPTSDPGPAARLAADRDERLRRRLCPLLSGAGAGPPPSPRSCSPRSRCGCGACATACRSSTTPTRTRTSWPARSACSGTPTTRTTSSTRRPSRTCCTPRSSSASAAATASRRPTRPTRATSSRVARALSGVLGAIAVGLLGVGGRAAVRPPHRLRRRRGAPCWRSPSCPSTTPTSRSTTCPTLAPLCLALVGVGGVFARGRLVDYALAGVGLGLACATKYTGGIVLLPLLAAAAGRPRAGRRRRVGGLALAGVLALARSSSSPTRSRCSTSTRSATA